MKSTTYFCFREAKNEVELISLLRLRYETYRSSKLAGFCPKNPHGIDLDAWDSYAMHFGLFQVENGKVKAVGYMRVIQQEETLHANWVRQIAWRYSMKIFEKIFEQPKVPFPSLDYYPGAMEVMNNVIRAEMQRGEKYCEASRLILRNNFRSLKLCIRLIEGALAMYFFNKGFTRAIVTCSEPHSRFYQRYGWQQLNGIRKEQILKGKTNAVGLSLLLLLLENYNKTADLDVRQRITYMAQTYHDAGQICFYPDQPNYFYPPAYFAYTGQASRRLPSPMLRAFHTKPIAQAS